MEHLKKKNYINNIISIPFIVLLIIPFVFLDLCVEIYHRICFPLYGIKIVNRSKYIILDRYKLDYLTGVQKSNCAYCEYINGLLKYVTEIGARTEKYWCAIKHSKKDGVYPDHHKDFLEYGDVTTFSKEYKQELTNLENKHE
ncbi:MAG: hypothetical protein ACKUBY_03380 [Candidatus Moraniibacteriota bacterium]|jgi:hypothetical protein